MIKEIQNISLKMDELIKVLTPPSFYLNWSFWSTLVLIITLLFLIWYTIETHKLAIQAKDNNLRPVVLRSGYLNKWEDLRYTFRDNKLETGTPLQFTILKNIATSIRGYVIVNGERYKLLFGNDISKIDQNEISFLEQWGWMKPDTCIYALFNETGQKSDKPNQIVIQYKDIEGNSYYTVENRNFDQKSFKGKIKT
jgi:hypothetical protein